MRISRGPQQRATVTGWHGVAAVILGLLAALLAAAPTHASGPKLKLGRFHTSANAPLTVKVFVYSRVALGAYTLQLSFDPAVLDLVGISGGSAEFAPAPFANPETFASGVVRFSAFQPLRLDGPVGHCHVATLTFQPQVARGRTRIELQAITLADTLGSTYHPPKRRKTLRLRTQ